MLNKFPLWKNLLILLMVILSAVYAAPNFYKADPAIQISHECIQRLPGCSLGPGANGRDSLTNAARLI